ncbi:MAG: cation:proton antiporter [Phycisphaerae bacterium]
MSSVLIFGLIVLFGFVGGELARKVGLPKVTGFILAGIVLNPRLTNIVPPDFAAHTDIVLNVALAFITFSVGGTLHYSKIKKLGKGIVSITFFEGEFAFLVTAVGIALVAPLFIDIPNATWLTVFIPVGLMMGSLASPTDPSATLAVVHEYKAHGPVSSTIMGVAALDDTLGIINYSIAVSLASVLAAHQGFSFYASFVSPMYQIFGAIGLGIIAGVIFNLLTIMLRRETEGSLIVAVLAVLTLCFGLATLIGVDELLAAMTMGAVVVNFNSRKEKIFRMLERYTDELIFVFFFALSGMHLDFAVFFSYLPLAMFFVIFRTVGKISGAVTGAAVANSEPAVKKYAWGGLIPQGGIVIGLALLIKQIPAFTTFADMIISIIIGATVIHELVGPVISKMMIKAAGEIPKTSAK